MKTNLRLNPIWFSFLLFIVASFYLSFFCRFGFKIADEGIPLNGALRVLRGEVPWVDFHGYAPGRYWLYALVFKCFGTELMAIRYAIAVLTAVATTLIFIVARYVMSAPFAFMASFLYLAAPGVYYGRYTTFFMILSFFPILAYFRGMRGAPFFAGFIGGLASFFRQDVGYILIGVPIIIFFIKDAYFCRSPAKTWRDTQQCLIGAALFWVPLIAIMIDKGIFWKMIGIHNRFALGGYQQLIRPFPKLFSGPIEESLLFYGPVMILICMGVYLGIVFLKKKLDIKFFFILFVFIAELGLFNQAIWRTEPENTLKVMVPILIFYCFFCDQLFSSIKNSINKVWFLSLILIFPLAYIHIMNTKYQFFLGSAGSSTEDYQLMNLKRGHVYALKSKAVVFEEIVHYVQATTRKQDPIYITPFFGLPVYFLADRKNSTFYEWILPSEPVTFPDIEKRIQNDLEKNQTDLIIHYDIALDGKEERRFRNYATKLHRYIFDHYYLDRTIENFWMLRRGDPNFIAIQQQTDAWTEAIRKNLTWGQTFISRGSGLNEIKVRLGPRSLGIKGHLILHLTEDQNRRSDILTVTVDFKNTVLDEWLSFRFPPIGESEGKAYYFYLEASDDPQIDLVVLGKFSQDNYPEGRLMRDHLPQEGDLSFVALRESK